MRRLALGFLGFTGAFVPLFGLDFLRESLSDGLEGARLPLLSSSVLTLAPIGHMLWVTPILVAAGVYSRTGKENPTSDAVWAVVGAILLFGCVMGALIPAYSRLLFLDGTSSPPPSALQWAGNLIVAGASIVFAASGLLRRRSATEASTGLPATSPESKPEGSDKPQPESEGRSR